MASSKLKTARAVTSNKGVEAEYRRKLDALIDEMSKSVRYWLQAAYKNNTPLLAQDALPADELTKRVKELSKRWIKRFDDMANKIAVDFITKATKHTDNSFMASLKDAGWTVQFKMTREVRDVVKASVQANVALIKSIPQQYFTDIEGIVMRGVQSGRDLKTVSDELKARYGVTKRRAALIARDQADKATAAVVKARRAELGITEAIWIHSGAGKDPRPSHVKAGKDKLRFNVNDGAFIDGKWIQPGEEINCRCSSRSVLPF